MRVPKTAELVAGHLRAQIVRGELRDGDALPPEMELVERYGISRPTLREAFRVLESEALISVRRGARGRRASARPDDGRRGPQRGDRPPVPRHDHGRHLPGADGDRGAVRSPARPAPHEGRSRRAVDEGRGGRGRNRRARPVHPPAHRVPRARGRPRRQRDAGAAQRHGAPHHRPGQLDPVRPGSRWHHPEGGPSRRQGAPPPRRAHRGPRGRRGRGVVAHPPRRGRRVPHRGPGPADRDRGPQPDVIPQRPSARALARSALPFGERGISSTNTMRRGAL